MLENLIDLFKTSFMEINGQGLKMPKSRIRNKKKKRKSINTKKKNIKLASSSKTYESAKQSLGRLFRRYQFEELAYSIVCSEIWFPNRSCLLKHSLLWGSLLEMKREDFQQEPQIKSYLDFRSLMLTMYGLLPDFPASEDFVPEADWGEIKLVFMEETLPVLYGGSVERITDFINAFEIRNKKNTQALIEMRLAIEIQRVFIESIPASHLGSNKYIEPGTLTIPSEQAWQSTKIAIEALNNNINIKNHAGSHLVNNDNFHLPHNESEFTNKVVDGSFQNFFFAFSEKGYFPVSVRNLASIIIDRWSEVSESSIDELTFISSLSNYIKINFKDFLSGPLILQSESILEKIVIPGLIFNDDLLYVILPTFNDSQKTKELTKSLSLAFSQGENVTLYNPISEECYILPESFSFEEGTLAFLYVSSVVTTKNQFLDLPIKGSELLSLYDFVTIFSSLDDSKSLISFFNYLKQDELTFGLSGPVDKLAAYIDSHSVLVDGANEPTHIMLDPHYGCDWRFGKLKEYWCNAPKQFPVKYKSWCLESNYDDIYSIIAKDDFTISWYTVIGECEVHFYSMNISENLEIEDAKILTLALEAFTDALKQREELISSLNIFCKSFIRINCIAAPARYDDKNITDALNSEFLINYHLTKEDNEVLELTTNFNLSSIFAHFREAKDASAQAKAVHELLVMLSTLANSDYPENVAKAIKESCSRSPRVLINAIEKNISLPEYSDYETAHPRDYKLARKELAIILKSLGVKPGRYELSAAKKIINDARDKFRVDIHRKIQSFNRAKLIELCITQHEKLFVKSKEFQQRIIQSLKHEVAYDREEKLHETKDKNSKDSQNIRYLIEFCVGMEWDGGINCKLQNFQELIGKVDWLSVLYSASDILHNGIQVAGIEINDDFVPEVFYSKEREEQERKFTRLESEIKLGKGLNEEDQVSSNLERFVPSLDSAFETDLGFKFTLMIEVLSVMSKWTQYKEGVKESFIYQSEPSDLVNVISMALGESNRNAINNAINFLTLEPKKTLILFGKNTKEPDVPVWEHNKRAYRYTLRPIVPLLGSNDLLWGAGMAEQARNIWAGAIAEGYLPTEQSSKLINGSVRRIKESIEKDLEYASEKVVRRYSNYVLRGIDFKRRFKSENFDDVGDYDVLAYWPNENRWLTIECKYVQPSFCIKDSKRLQDKMFDKSKGKSHLCKIAKRREFLLRNLEKLRELLKWPATKNSSDVVIEELYVSKNTYWCMYVTPYPVPTEFVQIDRLDNWFITNGFTK